MTTKKKPSPHTVAQILRHHCTDCSFYFELNPGDAYCLEATLGDAGPLSAESVKKGCDHFRPHQPNPDPDQ